MSDNGIAHSANNGGPSDINIVMDEGDPNDSSSNEIDIYLEMLKKQGISIQIASNIPLEQRKQLVTKLQLPLSNEHMYTTKELNILQQQKSQLKQYESMQNEFQQVQNANGKRKRVRSSNIKNVGDRGEQVDVLNNNKFALLSDDDSDDESSANQDKFKNFNIVQLENVSKNNNNNNGTVPEKSHTQRNKQPVIKEKSTNRFCPPIIVYNVDIRELVLQFKSMFPNTEMKIVNVSKTKSKIYVRDFDEYTGMMNMLREKNISSHSFTPEQNKQITLILRGLHYRSMPEEVKDELNIICPNLVVNVQPFYTTYMRKNNIETNLFLITLAPGKSVNDVTGIKYILYQKISWEKPNNYSKEVQCKRCQRWGHIAKNCNHIYNCVKCDQIHNPGECSLSKDECVKPYCINCKKWGHHANFRGCEAFVTYQDAKNKVNSVVRNKHINSSSFVKSNVSFANIVKNNNVSNYSGSNSNAALIKEFLLLAKQLLSEEPVSVETRIKLFMQNFKSLTIDERKKECFDILKLLDNNDP